MRRGKAGGGGCPSAATPHPSRWARTRPAGTVHPQKKQRLENPQVLSPAALFQRWEFIKENEKVRE